MKRIILIGDAHPNTEEDVIKKRGGFGEARYRKTQFAQPTFCQAEINMLKDKGIPVDCFYVNYRCQSSFEGISKATGGTAFALSVTKVEGRELLIGHITTSILKHVGGDGKGDELVGAYIKKFGKMHS